MFLISEHQFRMVIIVAFNVCNETSYQSKLLKLVNDLSYWNKYRNKLPKRRSLIFSF